ncbi:MAG: DUF4411 family protein [Bacteroidia bacterium]
MRSQFAPKFFQDSSITLTEYSTIAVWANSMANHYKSSALEEFLDAAEADALTVAFLLNQNIPLITYEKK